MTYRIRKKLFIAACVLGIPVALLGAAAGARAQGTRKDDIVLDAQGHPVAGATVRVCSMPATGQPCTPLADIYSDIALTQPLANPITTDGLGNYSFYAAPGLYEIEISGSTVTTKQFPNVLMPGTGGGDCSGTTASQILFATGTYTCGGDSGLTYDASAHSVGGLGGVLFQGTSLAAFSGAPTVMPHTAGSTTYGYTIIARRGNLSNVSSAQGTTALAAATITGTNTITVSWSAIAGATSYDVYRSTSSGTPSSIGLIGNTTSTTFVDTGIVAQFGAVLQEREAGWGSFPIGLQVGNALSAMSPTETDGTTAAGQVGSEFNFINTPPNNVVFGAQFEYWDQDPNSTVETGGIFNICDVSTYKAMANGTVCLDNTIYASQPSGNIPLLVDMGGTAFFAGNGTVTNFDNLSVNLGSATPVNGMPIGSITNAAAVNIEPSNFIGAPLASLTNLYGLHVGDQTGNGATHSYELYLDPLTSAGANDYAIYSAGGKSVLDQLTVNSATVAPVNFSALPACASAVEGTSRAVKDSMTNTWGATITGSGSDHVLAYCDGTNWTVAAK